MDDLYDNFNFRVKWDGKYIAGVSKVSGLVRITEVVEHRVGGDPSSSGKTPGRTEFEAITLERGLTQDHVFEQWADAVSSESGAASANFRKDIIIELYNESAQLVAAYDVYRCWPSRYLALSPLNAEGDCIVIEQLTLQNEGWARDKSVVPPAPGQ